MNADTFDTHSHCCPVCHRAGAIKPPKLIAGLLTCPHCRSRLVVSWSGHYVRDPFILKSIVAGQRLRRESHPFARICRDFRLTTQPFVLAILGTAVFLGTALVFAQTSSSGQPIPTESLPSMSLGTEENPPSE